MPEDLIQKIDEFVKSQNLAIIHYIYEIIKKDENPHQLKLALEYLDQKQETKDLFLMALTQNYYVIDVLFNIAVKNNHLDFAEKILNINNDLGMKGNITKTNFYVPLIQLAAMGNPKAIALIYKTLDSGIAANISWLAFSSLNGSNPEMFFGLVKKYDYDLDNFNELINFGYKNNFQSGFLHEAAKNMDSPEVIRLLIDKGLDPNAKDIFGRTPADWALANGHLKTAALLTGKSEQVLSKDPKYNVKPDKISHNGMVKNLKKYLKRFDDSKKWVQFDSDGLCNGWSFLAALNASKGEQALKDFYVKCSLLSFWDGDRDKLNDKAQLSASLQKDYQNLNEIFLELSNDLLWFFQQSNVYFGLSCADRVRQLGVVSEKSKIVEILDFGLRDLTAQEQSQILDYANFATPLLNNCLIDAATESHDMSFFQNAKGEIQFFDPNIDYLLPSEKNYENFVEKTSKVVPNGRCNCFGFYHTIPEQITPKYMKRVDKFNEELILEFIINNPNRMANLQDILHFAVDSDLPIMTSALLNHPILREKFTEETIQECIISGTRGPKFRSIYVLYKQGLINAQTIAKLPISKLENILRTGYLNDDKQLIKLAKEAIENKLKPGEIKSSLVSFNLDFSEKDGLLHLRKEASKLSASNETKAPVLAQYSGATAASQIKPSGSIKPVAPGEPSIKSAEPDFLTNLPKKQ